ncbi:flagellar hook protein FlgE [Phycisphaera mikurensis]|uniref:Flagellar hook protein FlgE n=1 Tax=Phycisphaera mikurensis (strain NBRC 102666 / KCTC 22515 / FYK2301M01) TaxID=1142394 RepID=I0IGD7_PHYMF|nr:flagellar hook-basal body complex protein [Phycisphaera mikurensis]MBB6440297.1 flagellar hook protein FlgE [Phycisphaera mikurensis]BAM04325.1 putative flagellar hook protein FlgE [Phycisphaera mikurensis NBRC 102666]
MALTNALFTGLTGLSAASTAVDVAGNNIANVNTTAFKRSRVTFETQISQTLRGASAPTGDLGGTNPTQVGRGVRVGAIEQDFSTGSVQPTGSATDVAIEGNGFFVVDHGGEQLYTRNGNFGLDRDYNLVTADGQKVQGFGVDDDFNVVEGVLRDISIPTGVLSIAEPTTEVKFAGNLNAGGDLATRGAITAFSPLFSDAAATTPAGAASGLDGLFIADGTSAFDTGDVVTITRASRGGADLPDVTFEVGATNTTGSDDAGETVQDLMDFLDDVFGIDTADPAVTAGVRIEADGRIHIESNIGSGNAARISDANFVVNAETSPTAPFRMERIQEADGESTRTSFVAYDSLGTAIEVDLSLSLVNKDANGTQWRYVATAIDDTDLDSVLGTGLVSFNTEGELLGADNLTIGVDRVQTGAGTPLTFNIAFTDPYGSVTSLVDTTSTIAMTQQDGSPIGTLQDFDIGQDGTIVGVFGNGLLRDLGQIPIATFANNEGLKNGGDSTFIATANSGGPVVVAGGTAQAGILIGRSLELSNVDISREFVDLISASTGFSANSRVISTSDEMINELLSVVR